MQMSESVFYALSEAAKYDVWDTGVLIQFVWSNRAEPTPTVLLLPLLEASDETGALKPDWKIEVTPPYLGLLSPQVTTSGTLRLLDTHSPKVMLPQALLAVLQHSSLKVEPWKLLPAIIRLGKRAGWPFTGDNYTVAILPLPITFGDGVSESVSADLRRFYTHQGR
jgi:hypothetical protein